MKELINDIFVTQSEVERKVKWLSIDANNGHEFNGINILLRYLLKENEILKARVDMLIQENYLSK